MVTITQNLQIAFGGRIAVSAVGNDDDEGVHQDVGLHAHVHVFEKVTRLGAISKNLA